jgi:hypothetical protein
MKGLIPTRDMSLPDEIKGDRRIIPITCILTSTSNPAMSKTKRTKTLESFLALGLMEFVMCSGYKGNMSRCTNLPPSRCSPVHFSPLLQQGNNPRLRRSASDAIYQMCWMQLLA